ncbi:HupE/UreJ family protein [Ramlibacter aquaticus]|uniref:HupE/UreJ family protein n=2 Tax=Comamonadaceae TaxID=80864 RepID=A0ABR9SAE4_9BURK|nr:HupE/UreJ family protein [Ramlibacter aquaticus]
MRRFHHFAAALLALLLLAPLAALAHKPSDSYLTLAGQPGSGDLKVRWDIALRDLDYVLELDRDGNGALTWGEVRARTDDITRYATGHLALEAGGHACTWERTAPMQLEHHSDGTYAVLRLAAHCGALEGELKARYSLLFDVDPSHHGLVQWIAPGSAGSQALVFTPDSAEQVLALQPQSAWRTLRQYLVDGVWHIWVGYDHILFLLSLLLPSVLARRDGRWVGVNRFGTAFKEVLKVVTAFTLAHSITLSLAALHVISLPSRIVESAIAASVVFAALNNLRGAIESKRWVMAFCFGLIHGFGFASVLADLGLPQEALALALVGFNLGVEVGQMAIVAVFLPLAFLLRGTGFYRTGVLKAGSAVIALVAAWWFVQRAFDIQGGPF